MRIALGIITSCYDHHAKIGLSLTGPASGSLSIPSRHVTHLAGKLLLQLWPQSTIHKKQIKSKIKSMMFHVCCFFF